jgi:phage replication O-like protein O
VVKVANPQIENGYTKIANEIMESLAKIRIPGEARQMLDVIIRKTYGFNKKEDQIATSQFCELTGLKPFIIHRARKRLLLSKLITVSKNANSQIISYSFQKDYSKWVTISKNAQCAKKSSTVCKNAHNSMQKCSPTVTIIDVHKRKKETITKETIQKKGDFPFLKDDLFLKTFNDFLDMRKKIKKQATDQAQELILGKLHKYSIEVAISMLEQSIISSWTGVFELKKERKDGIVKNSNRPGSEYAGIETEVSNDKTGV